jgi:hypothetical protein
VQSAQQAKVCCVCAVQDAIAFRAFEKEQLLTLGTDHYEVTNQQHQLHIACAGSLAAGQAGWNLEGCHMMV